MRIGRLGIVALAFSMGCARFGYDPRRVPAKPPPDASHRDAEPMDSRAAEDARTIDTSMPPEAPDAAVDPVRDATVMDAGREPRDAAVRPTDSGADASDGQTGDASQEDGAVELPCPGRPGAVFCDDFEDATREPWDFTRVVNGTAEQTTELAHESDGSLRATTGAASADNAARYSSRSLGGFMSGDLWLRYFYYLPSTTVVNTAFSTAVLSEGVPPFFGFSLVIVPTRVELGSLAMRYPGTLEFPRNEWTCVELRVAIDATDGVFEAYLDGNLAATSLETPTLPAAGYTNVEVGIHFTDVNQGPVEAYVDDVVVATTRVGCN